MGSSLIVSKGFPKPFMLIDYKEYGSLYVNASVAQAHESFPCTFDPDVFFLSF